MKISEIFTVISTLDEVHWIKIVTPEAMSNYSYGQSTYLWFLLKEKTFVCFGKWWKPPHWLYELTSVVFYSINDIARNWKENKLQLNLSYVGLQLYSEAINKSLPLK